VVVLPESLSHESRRAFHWKRANPLGTLLQMRTYPLVLAMLFALFLWQLAHQVMPSTWAFFTMFKFGWSTAVVGASLAFVGVTMAVSQATLPRVLIPRLGEAKCVMLGLTSGLIGFLGYAFATRSWMMFALLLTWFFGALASFRSNAEAGDTRVDFYTTNLGFEVNQQFAPAFADVLPNSPVWTPARAVSPLRPRCAPTRPAVLPNSPVWAPMPTPMATPIPRCD
jgi:hypothetical protein